jgi:hypothetical protein
MARRLLLIEGEAEPALGEAAWSGGAAQYWIERDSGAHMLIVAARCRLGTLDVDDLALLDTGAQWTVIGGELTTLLTDQASNLGESTVMSTRFGNITGHFHRMNVTLVADDGFDLEIGATVLFAPEWPGPVVLGYRGLLERVRIALDPGVSSDDQWMYFGAAS